MAQSLRQIKNRIKSIENTRKVTSAMQMVSISKLNRIDNVLFSARPYLSEFSRIFNNLLKATEGICHPLLEKRALKKKVTLCVITSDSGLCGVYNNNVIRIAEQFARNQGNSKVDIVAVGKKGFNYFRNRGFNIINSFLGVNGRFSEGICRQLSDYLCGLFIEHLTDEVYIAYTHYDTALIYRPVLEKFLELEPAEGRKIDYICEPDIKIIIDEIIPNIISIRMRLIMLESFTSEHAARTVAMKMATDNAKELLQGLTLMRNKMRQADITQDIMEIISSAEALKG